jgi:hypothetical protein
MKIIKVIYSISFLLYIFCCSNQKNERVIVKGYIIDSLTKMPIKKAHVTVVCWYYAGWDERNYQYIDTISNEEGYFYLTFEDGYKIIVASVASNYNPAFREINGVSDPINVELNLVKKSSDNIGDSVNINLRKFIISNTED